MADDGEELKFHGSPLATQPFKVVDPHVGLPGSSLHGDYVVSVLILTALTVKPSFPRKPLIVLGREGGAVYSMVRKIKKNVRVCIKLHTALVKQISLSDTAFIMTNTSSFNSK